MKISVVIVAWDEGKNLEYLTKEFIEVFKKLKTKYELIYILRGTKETSGYNVLKRMNINNLHLFYANRIHGYGKAFKYGFNKVSKNSDYILTLDGDCNHMPKELPIFLGHNEDVIIGSRYLGGKMAEVGPLWKRFLSKKMNDFMSFMFNLRIADKTSGYRLYRKGVIDWIKRDFKSSGFEVLPEILILANRNGFTIKEVPITFSPRVYGESKMVVKKTIIGYLKLLWRY